MKRLLVLFVSILCIASLSAQRSMRSGGSDDESDRKGRFSAERDSTDEDEDKIPIGLFQWRIDQRLGTIVPAENNDTVVHNYQNFNYTDGYTGSYNYLANIGSPRLNRIYLRREDTEDFLFISPLSYFRGGLQDFRFTNTLSPITNLSYHSAGSTHNGEDRVRAYFATNINKVAGIGFKMDYAYGRGYYGSSATSLFGSTFYGYYLGDHYNVHGYININHMKMAENGGIEDDRYIENPQAFPQNVSSQSIPTVLDQTWNRNHEQNFYLTHKYNLGFYREIEVPDSLKPQMPSDSELMVNLNDSIRNVMANDSVVRVAKIDSLRLDWQSKQIPPTEFIPVSSIIHTFDMNTLNHSYIAHDTPSSYDGFYTHHYYGDWSQVQDDTYAMSIRNTFGLALREGFHKWAAMGLTAFATHRLRSYKQPDFLQQTDTVVRKWTENDISVGAELSRTQGTLLHYNATGELWLIGEKAGDFDINGHADLNVKLGRFDTLSVNAHARVARQLPGFYLRHYHSQSTWWDNDLDRDFRTRVEGTVQLKKLGTRLHVGFENVTNYTYLGIEKTEKKGRSRESLLTGDYTHNVAVRQYDGNIQVFSATVAQDLALGPVHWDNEVTYQATSKSDVLPLPTVNIYSNLYFLFRYAKVLRVQAGADLRYFTSYYAPDYAPSVQQFAVQDQTAARMKIGNYPIINVYLNMHLKHCRLYAALSHVNAGNGHYFLAPHYPINPLSFRFGLSWNFFN